MAAPGMSFANPGAGTPDGVSAMIAKVRDRAGRRRAALNIEPQEVIDPLESQAASDAMQAPDISSDAPAPLAAFASRAIQGGGSPFRTASMTEDDSGEVTQTSGEMDCSSGVCRPVQRYDGLPPGARIISERTISSGSPSTPGGEVSAAATQYYPSAKLQQLDDAWTKSEKKTAESTASYHRDRARLLGEFANMPGVPFVVSNRMAQEAAHHNKLAGTLDQAASAERMASQKAASEADMVAAEKSAMEFNKQMQLAATPEGRMQSMRNVVADSNNPINSRPDLRPEARAHLFQQDLKRARTKYLEAQAESARSAGVPAKASADAKEAAQIGRFGDSVSDEEEYQMLVGYAYASDVARLVVQAESAKRLPFGDKQQRDNTLTQSMIVAKKYYGQMDPQTRDDALFFELQPAISARMALSETNSLRAQTGNPQAQLPAERLYEIEMTATGHVQALRDGLASMPQQPMVQGAQQPMPQQAPQPSPQPQRGGTLNWLFGE